jgi:hypothetical protein
VLDGGVINLMLNASVSDIDATDRQRRSRGSVPGFRTRRTSTTVELRDGESFAIAGLLQDDFFGNNRQVPWLGQLPVIGALFRSSDFRRNQSELVIFVTAHLVSPDARRGAGHADRPGAAADRGGAVPARAAAGSGGRGGAAGFPRRLRLCAGLTERADADDRGGSCCWGWRRRGLRAAPCARRGASWTRWASARRARTTCASRPGELSYAVALGQRFAAEVPSTVNFAFDSAALDAQAQAILRGRRTGSGSSPK